VFVVGLTGGIGSGKSTAAGMFAELGAAIVDTDEIARELTAPGGAAMPAIRERFGAEFVTPDGALDRPRMRRLVFANKEAKATLEAILHPLIRTEALARIRASGRPYVVVVVPLLLETGAYRDFTDRVLVIDCPEDEQLRRVTQRSGIAEQEVRAIMAEQLPRADRLAHASDVLENIGSVANLRRQVARLHAQYLELAARRA
jgi:dephospho-CoA kinase